MNQHTVKPLFEDASAPAELRDFVLAARSDGPSQADLDRLATRLAPAVGLSAGLMVSGSALLGTPPVGALSAASSSGGAAKVGVFGKLLSTTTGKLVALGLSAGVAVGVWTLGESPAHPAVSRQERQVAEPSPTLTEQSPVESPSVSKGASAPEPVPAAPPPSAHALDAEGARRARVKPMRRTPVVTRPPVQAVAQELAEPALAAPAPAEPKPSELSLIREAESKRAHGVETLAILARHERLYPHGALAQEREVLVIEMLLKARDVPKAQARAQRFEAAYPGSAHLPRLRALIERAAAE